MGVPANHSRALASCPTWACRLRGLWRSSAALRACNQPLKQLRYQWLRQRTLGVGLPTTLAVSSSSSSVHSVYEKKSQNWSILRRAEKSSRYLESCGNWPRFQHCFKKREVKPHSPPLTPFQLLNQLLVPPGSKFSCRYCCISCPWGWTRHPDLPWCSHTPLCWAALAAPISQNPAAEEY